MIKGARGLFINESRDLGTEAIATIDKEGLGERRGAGSRPKAGFFNALTLQDEDFVGKRKFFPFSRCV